MKQISIKHISNVHSDALRALALYSEELNIFQERLEEIRSANTGLEVSIQVEHFQNLIIIHKEQISEIRSLLKDNLHAISGKVSANSGFLDDSLMLENYRLNEQFLNEERLFREMKIEFYQFAAKWM
ncbi:hypothetical protein [Pedobacter kyonggii]|uniref:Uncharacterized protein n=1 Tax=Pedobacter kyonggii TaxID=1926871 RepID=A0A4Q9HGP2_9SPHI|nr:hypothetical protein [Pedobacter kyonggii]TBO43628.1 hypothetical protein EYS08_06665 [Pedobacter kyonggii]